MTELPRVPPTSAYPPPPLSGSYQSLSPGAGWPPPAGQPVDDLPTEAYASWIRRVGAFIVDQMVYLTLAAIIGLIGGVIVAAVGGSSGMERILDIIFFPVALAYLIWNWGYRQGTTGSTVGKSVLKFKVVDERDGRPIGFGRSIVRYFAHFIDSIIFGIGYLLPLVTAKRQTIADMMMSTVCLPNEPPSAPRSDTARPRIRMALGVVVLVIAAILTVLACRASTVVGSPGRHFGQSFLNPYVQSALVTPLWTAGVLILRRYHRWTYALVPIASIVASSVFAQGRYDWGWYRNYFAFLACVFVTTAVCLLIARGINRVVAARQAEAEAYRERKAARQQRLTPTLPPPGWYPDPSGDPQRQRHWDGRQWTEQWR